MKNSAKSLVKFVVIFIAVCSEVNAYGVENDRKLFSRSPEIIEIEADKNVIREMVKSKIPLGAFWGAKDLCISEENGLCWVLNRWSINVVELKEKQLVGAFGDFHRPLAMRYLTKSNRIIVVDAAREHRGSIIKFYDLETGNLTDEIMIDDNRACKFNSVILSNDESRLWLVTHAARVSMLKLSDYDPSRSAMYEVDLDGKKAELCIGEGKAGSDRSDFNGVLGLQMRCVLDAKGRLFLSGHSLKTISQYDETTKTIKDIVKLKNEPCYLNADPVRARLYVIFPEGGITVIDTDKRRLVGEIPTDKVIENMLVLSDTNELLLADKDSHELQVYDAETLEKRGVISLPGTLRGHPKGIGKLAFHKESRTLVAVVRTGFGLALYDCEGGSGVFLNVRDPMSVHVGPKGKLIYTCNKGSGNISVVDLVAERFVGTIEIGGSPFDMEFLPDGRTALISDRTEKRIVVLDLEKKKILKEFKLSKQPISVISSKDGKRCAIASNWSKKHNDCFIVDLDSGKSERVRISSLVKEDWPGINKTGRAMAIGEKTGVQIEVPGWIGSKGPILIDGPKETKRVKHFAYDTTSVVLSPDEKWAYITCRFNFSGPVLVKISIADK